MVKKDSEDKTETKVQREADGAKPASAKTPKVDEKVKSSESAGNKNSTTAAKSRVGTASKKPVRTRKKSIKPELKDKVEANIADKSTEKGAAASLEKKPTQKRSKSKAKVSVKPDTDIEANKKTNLVTPAQMKQAAKTNNAVGKQERVYEEPETQLMSVKPPVEDALAIEPPIPEQRVVTKSEVVDYEEQDNHEHHYQHPGPQYDEKFIVQITPELAPLAKVGGLADVVTGLSRELEMRGNSVEIILPKYDCMRYDHIWGLCKTFDDLWVPWYGGHIHCTVWFGFVHDRKCFFIEPHSQDDFFNRGSIYGFDDDILRFAFFSRAAIEFLWRSGKHPDVIHCHDWQTALVPVFLFEIYQHMGMTHPRVCYTIHNYKHQGKTGDFVLQATGLNRPEYYFHTDRLLDNHTPQAINLMKGGIVYSNFITTVSPKYAGETKDGGQGFGLEPTLHAHHYKYGGIVNGIDYDAWNPAIDAHIPFQYDVHTIDEKYKNKRALRERLLLADCEKPIIVFIGRLDPQKGLDLVRHALFYALNNAAQFILLGSSPDNEINNHFWDLKRHLNDSPDCHIEVGFDEELAHLIYAGSDMMIVPSLFEPCGLTQLISMQYGSIPIVRSVGGLADTVFDKDNAHDKPLHERNGYSFDHYNNAGIESAMYRAISCYYQYPEDFRELIKNAMNYDYSWRHPGQHYLNIYNYISE